MGPDPGLAPDGWNIAFIAGELTPGIVSIEGEGLKLKWDDAKGTGTSGATSKFVGRDISKFTMKVTFVEGYFGMTEFEQRLKWSEVIIPLMSTAFEGKTALDFYHPAVSEPPIDIRSVDIEHIRPMRKDSDTGFWSVSVDFKRYARPKPGLGTPSGSSKKKNKKAKDAADVEIDKLSLELATLSGE